MAVFSYKAVSAGGAAELQRGTITADSARQARDTLREQGLRVREIAEVRRAEGRRWKLPAGVAKTDAPRRGFLWPWQRARLDSQVVSFTRELSTLLMAGIPLLQALDSLARQNKGRFRDHLLLLRERVTAGVGLAEAMEEQPEVFDALSIRMVDVGERTGTLDEVLRQLADFKQRVAGLKGRIGTAMIYPVIVISAGVIVTLFLMTFVVPNLLETLQDTGGKLPLATLIVKSGSDLIVNHWLILLVLMAAAIGGLVTVGRSQWGKRAWHRLQLRLPLLGPMMCKQAVVQMSVTIAALTRSGVEFVQALQIAARTTQNLTIREAIERAERAVQAGRDIAPALEATGVFPLSVVQVMEVGQASGQLDKMLDRLAEDYDAQVQVATQRFVALLEPALILMLALFIGFIVLAVILPYMEAGNVS